MHVSMFARFLPNFPLAWTRITSTRSTLIYFILALLHCIVQVVFQVMAFQINDSADFILRSTINAAGLSNSYAQLEANGPLRLCTDVNSSTDLGNCPVVWAGQSSRPVDPNYADPSMEYSTASVPLDAAEILPSSSTFIIETATTTATPTASLSTPAPQPSQTDSANVEPISSSSTTRRRVTVTVTASREPEPSEIPEDEDDDDVDRRSPLRKRSLGFEGELSADGEITGVTVTGLEGQPGPVFVSFQCAEVITWPRELLRQSKRQDVVFIAFQIWTLGMSLVALFNESVPHAIAAFLTHLVNTAWSAGQLLDTHNFKAEFGRVAVNGACNGVNLLPQFWTPRQTTEIVIVVMDAVTLLLFAYLTWRLIKQFGWQTFKRVGASIVINRCYKIVLGLSILLQLAFFAVSAAMGLWLDLLYASVIGEAAANAELYKGLYITIFFVLIPWICLGWFAPRREHAIAMIVFLLISGLLLGGWGAMFASETFFHTFKDWTFFAVVTLLAAILTFFSATLGIVCFFNFGKGLAKYLHAREPLEDEPGSPDEKVFDIERGERYPYPDVPGSIPQFEVVFTDGGHTDESEEAEKDDHVRSLSLSTSASHAAPSHKPRRQASGGVSISSNGATSTRRWIIE